MKKKFIPREKQTKREKKALDGAGRAVWTISPVTRSAPNPKAYNRKKYRIEKEDFRSGVFYSV